MHYTEVFFQPYVNVLETCTKNVMNKKCSEIFKDIFYFLFSNISDDHFMNVTEKYKNTIFRKHFNDPIYKHFIITRQQHFNYALWM